MRCLGGLCLKCLLFDLDFKTRVVELCCNYEVQGTGGSAATSQWKCLYRNTGHIWSIKVFFFYCLCFKVMWPVGKADSTVPKCYHNDKVCDWFLS